MKLSKALFVVVIITLISACGFQLRGVGNEALSRHAVVVESNKKTVEPFVRQMLAAQLTSAPAKPVSTVVVNLKNAAFSKRTLVLDENAQPVKQLMRLSLNYQYTVDDKAPGHEAISLERSFYYSAAQLASISQFEDSLRRELLSEAAQQIQQQLISQVK